MPFGNADRESIRQISHQLTQITADLAAIRQQVSDQQHTIDQIRQDTTASITTGLAEIRAVARDAMARSNDITTGPLASIGSELVAIRGTIAQVDSQLRAQAASTPAVPETDIPPEPEPAADPSPPTQPEPAACEPHSEAEAPGPAEPDPDILRAAAGVAHATVEAHRDTWAFLIQVAGNEQHFHIPGKVEDHDGFVSVRFSGPSLEAAITSLGQLAETTGNPVTRAIADHIRQKITAAVQEIISKPNRGGDGTPVRIVIDDRAAPPETEEPPAA
ncbi:hypothetical protein A6P39_002005 [Streptomyces sp. FXJ1.172]|uniref:hypothetical protein n=1 Tax=Streptomyces sp. FXJ1.172 TaxID=710705 RepID=UPI0007CFC5D4|nr:hypothetical protein [Streptomyces sp. FXJ1.172]WEO92960.1 hypothetical protein A6P39_002005 [Streptomyces sp. FXJ1.172]